MHKFKPKRNLSTDQTMIDSAYSKSRDDSNIQNIIQSDVNILGEFLIVPQSCLFFGHQRKSPVLYRPVISLTRKLTGLYVCPCTSKGGKDKFKLSRDHVKWSHQQSDYQNSYVFWQYERIMDVISILKGKCVGHIDLKYRVKLTHWLNNRESCLYKQEGHL